MFQIASRYGKIIKSIEHADISNDLVALAIKHNALAVLSDKSKLIFYANTFQYWIANSLDMIKLTTEIVRQDKILSHFNLNTQTIKYLGILTGCTLNPILYKHLENLNHKIGADFFQEIARFINAKLKSADKDEIIDEMAKSIAIDSNDLDEIKKGVTEAYESFIPVEKIVPSVVDDIILNYALKNCHQNTFRILSEKPMHCFETFFNIHHFKNISYSEIISPLVRRKAGVLLKYNNNDSLKVSYYSHDYKECVNIRKFTVDPIYPDIEIPDIDQLLNQKLYASFDPDRFKLLCWIVASDKLNYLDIAWVDKNYLLTLMTLYFLLQVSWIFQ